ncbi:MAG TPA: prepilin-type N-terminal cleavage/methylation domain-containing protein [Methylococcaceae bacterium]|nr:prepilin-type N-terminal cleavage/methylation domain-containing protein [Methylococcaceae bacterium]
MVRIVLGLSECSMRLEQGFTLVELMVAMVVGSIAIASAYASYEVIAKQYEKVKGVTEMQSSSRSIMRIIERDIRMAGFKWRDRKGVITYGSISEPIKITDSGNKCCDKVTVVYDYRDEASNKVERVQIRYWVADYAGSSGTRGRLFRKTDILGRNKKILLKSINGNDDVLADYVEDLQFSDGSLLQGLIAIDLILRTKKQYGLDRNYAKKDHFGGNYDINKNDAYKRQEYSSTVLIRNPL